MEIEKGIFQRTELLLGKQKMEFISKQKVIIFGIGGVGSWCAESLIRTGIIHLTIVDYDKIAESNVNRQLPATLKTIGKFKTEVLKERLLEINPNAKITAIQKIYNQENHHVFNLESFDYIIDAIDSLGSKMHLIRMATRTNATLFSSLGAALKIDPSRIKIAEFWDVKGCPLGFIIRKKIRKGDLPAKKFLCVYSDEVLDNQPDLEKQQMDLENETDNPIKKAVINGTMAHITAIFGFTIAGLLVKDIYEKVEKNSE